jgi:uncharacterized protein YaaN involved in tellurite resistance
MADPNNTAANAAPLQVANAQALRKDLQLDDPAAGALDPALEAKAEAFVQALLAMDPKDIAAREDGKNAVDTMGLELQKRAAQRSQMLQQPIRKLTERSDDGGDVGNALISLKMEVEALDPGKLDLEPGWFSRLAGHIPGVGTPIKRYLTRYESAQTVIAAIIRSLEQGRDQLQRDNLTLTDDQKDMRELTHKIEQAVKLGQVIDAKLEAQLNGVIAAGSEQHRFVSEELLFPLRQRLMDLQQQLAVNQQGVLATEIVIRNNKELVRGVNRALNVTSTALRVGATVALALADQKTVIDKVDAVNKTTSDLIAGTSERLRTQGTQIHKQAASAQLDMNALKTAFTNLNAALEDLSSFRQKALPQMAQTVLELDRLTADAEQSIQKMERGNEAKPKLSIDIE